MAKKKGKAAALQKLKLAQAWMSEDLHDFLDLRAAEEGMSSAAYIRHLLAADRRKWQRKEGE